MTSSIASRFPQLFPFVFKAVREMKVLALIFSLGNHLMIDLCGGTLFNVQWQAERLLNYPTPAMHKKRNHRNSKMSKVASCVNCLQKMTLFTGCRNQSTGPIRFLAVCHKRRLNLAQFGLCLILVFIWVFFVFVLLLRPLWLCLVILCDSMFVSLLLSLIVSANDWVERQTNEIYEHVFLCLCSFLAFL